MKKQLISSVAGLLTMAGLAFGANETITFDDPGIAGISSSGTYNPSSTFSLDVTVSWTGYSGIGLSYWLQVPNALAPFITGTGETYFTWTDPNQTFFGSDQFNQTSGTDAGYMNADRDMGATSIFAGGQNQQLQPAGSYKVSNVQLALNGAPAGTYTLRTTVLTPKISQITEGTATTQTGSHALSQGFYTITIVPEPSTWSLLGLGGLGSLGLTWLRARRRA